VQLSLTIQRSQNPQNLKQQIATAEKKTPKCPLGGHSHKSSVIYKCEVSALGILKKVNIGFTEKLFKTRYKDQKQS